VTAKEVLFIPHVVNLSPNLSPCSAPSFHERRDAKNGCPNRTRLHSSTEWNCEIKRAYISRRPYTCMLEKRGAVRENDGPGIREGCGQTREGAREVFTCTIY
jgi:hypothetical protein